MTEGAITEGNHWKPPVSGGKQKPAKAAICPTGADAVTGPARRTASFSSYKTQRGNGF
jgi:hypothetical protein